MIRFGIIVRDGVYSQEKVRGVWSKRDNNNQAWTLYPCTDSLLLWAQRGAMNRIITVLFQNIPPKNYRKLTLFWETLLNFGLHWLRKETFLFLCVVRWAYDREGCVLVKNISQVCVTASLKKSQVWKHSLRFLVTSSFNRTQSLKYCLHSCFSFKPRLQISFLLSVMLLQEGEFLKNE